MKTLNFAARTLLSALLFIIFGAVAAHAATVTVTKTEDTNDGACNEDCSLREAIVAAAPGDTIVFASPLFDTPRVITLSDAAGFGELFVDKDLTINGSGAKLLTVRRAASAAAKFRVFSFISETPATVRLNGLTIAGGDVTGKDGNEGLGGGIFSHVISAVLHQCVVTGNRANNGGGIHLTSGAVLYITGSTISNNTATEYGLGAGGIDVKDKSQLVLINSTVSGNVKLLGDNYAAGGVFLWNNGFAGATPSYITNSTITDNATAGPAAAGGVVRFTGSLTVRGSIIAANRNNAAIPDFYQSQFVNAGTITTGGYNLIGRPLFQNTFTQTGDQTGTEANPLNPRLLTLGDYGGQTPTHAFAGEGPAIDKGKKFDSMTDQRGAARPFDNPLVANATGGDGSDIGAFEAASFGVTVTKTADTNDGVCDADCSLREAIDVVIEGGTVEFAAPLFDSPQTLALSLGELIVDKTLTINGKGASLLTVRRSTTNGTPNFRIFHVGVDSPINVKLSGMTITGGSIGGSASGSGGGIRNNGANLTLADSHLTNNTSAEVGGGIFNNGGRLTVLRSTISNNIANSGFGGGGIDNGSGGLIIVNSTLSGNVKNGGNQNGGAIWTSGGSSDNPVIITNSTITDNQCAGSTCAGGIYNDGSLVTIRNSIVAANRNNAVNPDARGSFASDGYNYIGNGGGAGGFTATGDETGTSGNLRDPRLYALGNYGGATPTHALRANSPVIDKGNAFGETTDQRGVARAYDSPDSGGTGADKGAFEYLPMVTNVSDNEPGSLRRTVTALRSGDLVLFEPDFFNNTARIINLTSGQITVNKSLNVLGTGVKFLNVRRSPTAAASFRVFGISAGSVVVLSGMTISGGYDRGSGGGILNDGGALTVSNCHVTGNTALLNGGGIRNSSGTLNVVGTTVSGNLVRDADGAAGIHSSGAVLNVTNSTISGNVKNASSGSGGGVWVTGGAAFLNSSTITDNEAAAGGAGGAGGVYQSGGAAVTIRNSIVAANRSNIEVPDVGGAFISEGYNLIGNVGEAAGFDQPGDQTNLSEIGLDDPVEPNLAALADNGGATPTHALLRTSLAIDKGNGFGLATDQRGVARPFNNPNLAPADGGDNADIGAFEAQAFAPTAPVASATPNPIIINEDASQYTGLIVRDADADVLTLTVTSQPVNGTLVTNGDPSCGMESENRSSCFLEATYKPNADFNGTDWFAFRGNDGTNNSNLETVTVTVKEVNDPPIAASDSKTTAAGTPLTFPASDLTVNDNRGAANESSQTLTVTEVTVNSQTNGQVSLNNNQITYQPNANFSGAAAFDYRFCDNGTTGGVLDVRCGTGTVTVNVMAGGGYSISGAVNYGITPSGQSTSSVSGVNLTTGGAAPLSATTDSSGEYQLSGFAANGSYTVTPSKTGDVNGAVTSFDAALAARNAGKLLTLSPNQLLAADVSGNGDVSAFDAALIARTAGNISNPGSAGQWRFLPASIDYPGLSESKNAQDYQAILMGDISGNWKPAGDFSNAAAKCHPKEDERLAGKAKESEYKFVPTQKESSNPKRSEPNNQKPATQASGGILVDLPDNLTGAAGSTVLIPVAVGDLTGQGIISYSLTVSFDPAVLQPANPSFEMTNTRSGAAGLTITPNASTAGQINIQAFGTTNLSGSGTLLFLRFNVVGTSGAATDLSFNSFTFNEGEPQAMPTGGTFAVSVAPPTAATVTVAGRVTTAQGRGIGNVLVTMIDSQGRERTTQTASFGYYRFDNIQAGETVTISAKAKRYRFGQSAIVRTMNDSVNDADFVSLP